MRFIYDFKLPKIKDYYSHHFLKEETSQDTLKYLLMYSMKTKIS